LRVKIPETATLRDGLLVGTETGRRTVTVAVPRPDRYDVMIYPIGGPDAGLGTFAIAGAARRDVDLTTPEDEEVLPPVSLGVIGIDERLVVELSPETPLPAAVDVQPVREWATEWNVVGPFPNPRVLGTELSPAVDSVYGPERDPGLGRSYEGWEGRPVRWQRVRASDDGQVRLNAHFTPSDWVAVYAQAFLYSPVARNVALLFGADDAHVLWVNGARLSERQGRHISQVDELEVHVQLEVGWNRVLLKVADLDGGWAFQVRAADPEGHLRWSPVAR
jgi:hypothetical protein